MFKLMDKKIITTLRSKISLSGPKELIARLEVNYFEKVINYIQLHWKLFN